MREEAEDESLLVRRGLRKGEGTRRSVRVRGKVRYVCVRGSAREGEKSLRSEGKKGEEKKQLKIRKKQVNI